MLGDVALLLKPSLQNNVQLEFDLQPLPSAAVRNRSAASFPACSATPSTPSTLTAALRCPREKCNR
jgi:hypothetical protein